MSSGLAIGSSVDALLLTPQGKLDALVRLSRTGDDEVYIDVDAGFGPAVVARLGRFKLRVKADVEQIDWRNQALRGPEYAGLFGRLGHGTGYVDRGALLPGAG